jgi:hypothetical protein
MRPFPQWRRPLAAIAMLAMAALAAVSPFGAGPALAGPVLAGPVLAGPPGAGNGFEDCAHVPPAAPREPWYEENDYLYAKISWSDPVDVQLGYTCGPITGYALGIAYAEGSCRTGPTSPWLVWLDRYLPSYPTSETVYPENPGWYTFQLIASTPDGWGAWSPWMGYLCWDPQP